MPKAKHGSRASSSALPDTPIPPFLHAPHPVSGWAGKIAPTKTLGEPILVAPELVPLIQHVAIPHNHNPVEVTDHFPVIVRLKTTPPSGHAGGLEIARLMPNPDGDERQKEYVVLKNTGASAVSLTGNETVSRPSQQGLHSAC